MEIGNEISQKIRSAIKAKLVDLGAYVDDELPDYIMVMVANKKTQDQMTEDLNLFLGKNTVKFTAWLHALLNKLKSVTTGEAPPKPPEPSVEQEEESTPSPPDPKQEEPDPEPEDESPKEPIGEEMDENILTIRADQDDFDEEPPKKVAPPPQNSAVLVVQQPATPSTADSSVAAAAAKQVTTEVMPVASTTQAVTALKPTIIKPNLKEASKAATSVNEAVLASLHADKDAPKLSLPSRTDTKVSPKAKEPTSVTVRPVVARKRKMLGSVVGSVLHHYEEEEEYDPLRPMVGRVASAIAVQERKSSVPLSLQANRNLIFKAMNEASDSINRTTRIQEPVVKRLPIAVAPMRSMGRGRGGVRLGGSQLYEPPKNRPLKTARRNTGPATSMAALNAASSDRPGDRNIQLFSKSKREEVLHRLKWDAEADDVIQPPKYSLAKESHTTVAEDKRSVEYEYEVNTNEYEETQYQPSDTRISQLAEDEVQILETRRVQVKQEKPEVDEEAPSVEEVVDNDATLELETLVESGAEESDFTDADEPQQQEHRYVHQQISSTPSHEAPPSPKFVVTLDGVDPSILKKEINFEESMEDGADDELDLNMASPIYSTSPRNIVRVKPQVCTNPEITVNLNDDMESVTSGGDPPKKSKPGVRCKFWPACKSGESCQFHHPSSTCKMFPHCKFGDKCLFIHPNCKFDANCTKANCPFTHASVRGNARQPMQPVVIQPVKVVPVNEAAWGGHGQMMGAAPYSVASGKPPNCRFYPNCTNVNCQFTHPKNDGAQVPSQPTKCRFFPNCTNMNCPFLHPKPCRYGISCIAKATCPFSHPQLPSKDQLVWSSTSSAISSFHITDT